MAAGEIIEAKLYARGLGEGKGWKKVKEEVRVGRSKIEPVDFVEAIMTFHDICKVNNRDLTRINSQLDKVTNQVSMLAYLHSAESSEDRAHVKRQVLQKKAKVEN